LTKKRALEEHDIPKENDTTTPSPKKRNVEIEDHDLVEGSHENYQNDETQTTCFLCWKVGHFRIHCMYKGQPLTEDLKIRFAERKKEYHQKYPGQKIMRNKS
jgi:hypothetical protein